MRKLSLEPGPANFPHFQRQPAVRKGRTQLKEPALPVRVEKGVGQIIAVILRDLEGLVSDAVVQILRGEGTVSTSELLGSFQGYCSGDGAHWEPVRPRVGWPREGGAWGGKGCRRGKSGGSSSEERGRNKKDAEMETVEELLGSERDRRGKMGQTKALKESKGQEPGFNPWLGTKISHTAWRNRRKNKMKKRDKDRQPERERRRAGHCDHAVHGRARQ